MSNPQRPFRIFALPLARLPRTSVSPLPRAPPASPLDPPAPIQKPPTPLLLFHVSQPDARVENKPPGWPEWAMAKASDAWLKLGEKPKDSWMGWFYAKGESLMDRIEYEEWALKGVHEGRGVRIAKPGEKQERIEIPLLHPMLKDHPLPPLIPKLHRLLIHRIPYHKKMMTRALIFSPVTFPFALIPVIPNFPLFYVLWRAWSHYKAWRGATYLEELLKLGMIKETPSKALDEVYSSTGVSPTPGGAENVAPDTTATAKAPSPSPATSASTTGSASPDGSADIPSQAAGKTGAPDGTATPPGLVYRPEDGEKTPVVKEEKGKTSKAKAKIRHSSVLLSPGQIGLMQKAFDLRPQEVMDITRAMEQADLRAKAIDKKNDESEGKGGDQDKEGDTVAPGALAPGQAGKEGPTWRGNLHR